MSSALEADVSLTPRRNVSSHGFAERGPVEDGQYELSIPLRQCSLDLGQIASTVVLHLVVCVCCKGYTPRGQRARPTTYQEACLRI